jgi:hypothetical protein
LASRSQQKYTSISSVLASELFFCFLSILLHQSPNPQVASNVTQQVSQSKPPNASENQLIFRASLSDLCSHTCHCYQIQAQALYLLHDS